jgi:hypothetical protein
MKNLLLISITLLFLGACTNDIDRNITTNLQVEAKEIFQTSLTLEESLRYVFYSFEDYRNAITDTLPGCPTVLIDEVDKKIELKFALSNGCPTQKIERSGSIILEFNTINSGDQEILVSYANYKVEKLEIRGKRKFSRKASVANPKLWQEDFEDLLIIDELENSTKISGSYNHTLGIINDKLISYASSGSVEGRNITGRLLKMTQSTPRQYQNACVEEGQVIASTGVEIWEIFRTPTRSLAHTLTITSDTTCVSKVNIQLSDGRLISFE